MAVEFDKIQSRISQDENGIKLQRFAHVTGITGNADARLNNALNDASMPAIGATHPVITGITLQRISGRVIDNETVEVTLDYFDNPGTATTQATAGVRFTSSVTSEQVNQDINGDRLHFYTNVSTAGGFILDSGVFTAEVQRPRSRLEFDYTSTTYPQADISTYQGVINSAPWNGFPAKTMLCMIQADQEGSSYKLKYSFSENPDGWQFYAAIKGSNLSLPATAHATKPDNQVDLFAAAKYFDVYREADFNNLGFDLGLTFAEISGTAVVFPRINETDIVAGGKTLIITLYGGETWVTAGATFDAQRQNIIDGLVSNKSEAAGWNASTATICPVTSVVRTSSTVVTITFVLDAGYVITEPENISVTIPASALTTSTTDLQSITPFFTITGS